MTTLENMPILFLRSSLSSSPMGVFLRDQVQETKDGAYLGWRAGTKLTLALTKAGVNAPLKVIRSVPMGYNVCCCLKAGIYIFRQVPHKPVTSLGCCLGNSPSGGECQPALRETIRLNLWLRQNHA